MWLMVSLETWLDFLGVQLNAQKRFSSEMNPNLFKYSQSVNHWAQQELFTVTVKTRLSN